MRLNAHQDARPALRSRDALTVVIALLVTLPGVTRSDASAQSLERQMYVSVLDADGAPVVDLTVDDFTVREDGVLREVLRVSPATDSMQVALLVDNSVAMWPYLRDLRDLRDGLGVFVERLGGDHEVAVITFAGRPTIVEDYSRSVSELRQAIGRIVPRPGGDAPLLDAIYSAGEGMQRREAARPVLIAVTADSTEYRNRPYERVLGMIEATGATFHAVVLTAGGSVFGGGPDSETSSSSEGPCRPEADGSTCCEVSGFARPWKRSPRSYSPSTCSSTPARRCW